MDRAYEEPSRPLRMMAFRLSEDELDEVRKAAAWRKISRSDWLRAAIRRALGEDYQARLEAREKNAKQVA